MTLEIFSPEIVPIMQLAVSFLGLVSIVLLSRLAQPTLT